MTLVPAEDKGMLRFDDYMRLDLWRRGDRAALHPEPEYCARAASGQTRS
ncbi:MAG TPA: hypothetical protein VNM90_26190 [Haliangium sp.]|nr:hypothetical protein [Haliangium sp.]